MITTVTFDEIDRLFFEYLRRVVVDLGYLPDKRTFSTVAEYNAAKDTMRAALSEPKQLIEIFGVGSSESKDQKTMSKFVISRIGSEGGNIGGSPADELIQYQSDPNLFRVEQYPDKSENLLYEVRQITNNTKYDRILGAALRRAFGKRRYLKTVNDEGIFNDHTVLVEYTGEVDVSAADYMERVSRFRVWDLFIEEPLVIRDGIPEMTTIEGGIFPVHLDDPHFTVLGDFNSSFGSDFL